MTRLAGPDPDAVSTRADLAASLTAVRVRAGLTVRELARRLDVPHTTLGGYFSGRHVPTIAHADLVRAILAQFGIDDASEVDRWFAAIGRARAASDRRSARPAPPYRGLEPFGTDDADVFYGRRADTDELVDLIGRLRIDPGPSNGVVTVIGPSGSGKSSLLRAGLVATLRGQEQPWACAVMTPSATPHETLQQAVASLDGGDRLLVVDQFEEIFTSSDTATRSWFLSALGDLAPDTLIVLGMRADFYARAAQEPSLLPTLRHAQVLVGPLGTAGLREAVTGPARAVGAVVDDGLVDLVLSEFTPRDARPGAHDPGSLPLLSHAMLSTWERASDNRLTIADYRAAGGIDAAVQVTAEEAYSTLGPDDQQLARRLFLRMVTIHDVAITRRRVSLDELAAVDVATSFTAVIEEFVERRLLTTTTESVEFSHEALLTAWPRLYDWVDADRAGLRLHRQVTDAATAWRTADDDDALLLRGARLEIAREWAADPAGSTSLNRVELDYVEASALAARAERDHIRRRTRRLRALVTIVLVLVVITSGLAILATRSRFDADDARRTASTQRDQALARQVAFQAQQLAAKDPALAQQLALIAYGIAPTGEARGALIDQTARPVIARRIGVAGATPLGVSPDGTMIAVGHADDGSVHLYRTHAGAPPTPIGTLPGSGPTSQVFAIAFVPGTGMLAVGGQTTTVRLWDVAQPAHPHMIAELKPAFGGAIQSIAISPDRRTLAAGSAGPHPVMEWDITNPRSARLLPFPTGLPADTTIQAVRFDRKGTSLAAAGHDGRVYLWPASAAGTTRPQQFGHGDTPIFSIEFDPRAPRLYVGQAGGIDVWTLSGGGATFDRRLGETSISRANAIAAAPDGSQIALGDSVSQVRVWDTRTWDEITSTGNPGPVTGLTYSPDGKTLASTAADGTLRLQPTSTAPIPVDGAGYNIGTSADGSTMLFGTGTAGDHLQLWDMHDPQAPHALSAPFAAPGATALNGSLGLSRDARMAAGGTGSGLVVLWNTSNPGRPVVIGAPFRAAGGNVESVTFSPDGHTLAVGSDDHTATLFDVTDPAHPRRTATLRNGGDLMLTLAFNRDGTLLAGADADTKTYVWDVTDRDKPVLATALGGFKSYVYGVTFSPVDNLLAATSSDHTTRLWRLTDPRHPQALPGPLVGPTDYVYSPTFSPDGTRLAVGSGDDTVRIYAVDGSVVPQQTLTSATYASFAVVFSPDGKTIVASGTGPTATVWTTDFDQYARRLCGRIGDRITRAEWALYVPGAKYDPPCG